MKDSVTIPVWMLSYMIEPKSMRERTDRLLKVLQDAAGEEE